MVTPGSFFVKILAAKLNSQRLRQCLFSLLKIKTKPMRQLLILMATSSFLLYACGSQQDSGDASKQEPPQIDTAAMLSTGTQIAMATFGVLSAELSAAMARGGVAEAAPYCQLNALPIADSLSQV